MKPLPLPRLQLTWTKKPENAWTCSYDLLLPVGQGDVRNEAKAGKPGYTTANISATEIEDWDGPIDETGRLTTPFRDGAHAAWDAHRLGFPAFVVFGRARRQITPKQSPE